jgi:hypothetical protein
MPRVNLERHLSFCSIACEKEWHMAASLQKCFFLLLALGLFPCGLAAQGHETLRLTINFAKVVKVNSAYKGKFTAILGNPEIADVTFGPKNAFMFIGKKEGSTNIIVLNDGGVEIYNARIEVVGRVHEENLITIYNEKDKLGNYVQYNCLPLCEYVGISTIGGNPLPRGYTSSSETFQSNVTPGPPVPGAPPRGR